MAAQEWELAAWLVAPVRDQAVSVPAAAVKAQAVLPEAKLWEEQLREKLVLLRNPPTLPALTLARSIRET